MYAEVYYAAYLVACATIIVWLGRLLHRAGLDFLRDAFAGNPLLVASVSKLLNVGFYLMSLGYVAASFDTYNSFSSYSDVAKDVSGKIGWLLLLLGVVHLFNLLLLALFRRRFATPPLTAS
ncbi:MAG TPA: hypothetical protein VFU55_02560 [Terracidiphilus sp.]|nr:hypothetical protein [Terracidiphilus sp.]